VLRFARNDEVLVPAITRTATFWLAVLTTVMSIVTGLGNLPTGALTFGFVPAKVSGLVDLPGTIPAILTPLSATLVHGGFVHLAFNLLMLVWCGLAVERVLGKGALVTLYVVSAYVAMLAQWAVDPSAVAPVIGASGAVSGLIGAYALSFGRPKRVSASPAINRLVNILWLAAAWTVLQVIIGWASQQQGMLLATPAHVGGFVAGLALQRPLLLWRYRKA
jgi:membrane associated rhomboid family serine protease